MMNVPDRHLDAVRVVLARYVGGIEVRAFGSRVDGSSRRHSDLDLVVMSSRPLPLAVLGRLRGDFADSELPFRVDVADWARLSDGLREAIHARSKVVQAGGAPNGVAANDTK